MLALAALLAALPCGAYQIITNAAWDLRIETYSDSSPAVARDGTIIFGDWKGRCWAVNPNGTRRWTYETGSEIKSSPAVS